MPLIETGDPLVGTSESDVITDRASEGDPHTTIYANSGNDLVLGDSVFLQRNDSLILGGSLANALSLDDPQFWSNDESPLFGNSFLPHTTLYTGPGWYFSITAGAGDRIILDVDYGASAIGLSSDMALELLDENGLVLAANDDADVSLGELGSQSALDPYLSYTPAIGGTYYIRLINSHPGALLNISVSNHPVTGYALPGSDTIYGDDGDDQLFGMTGDDTIFAGNGDDFLLGSSGQDSLNGGPGTDLVAGGDGDDVLNGNEGADDLWGGLGNDVFYIEGPADLVHELSGEGFDRLGTSSSYALAAGAEIERLEAVDLAATTPLNLSGNEFVNSIIGNAGANRIHGGGGNDRLFGLAGDDILVGDAGNDELYGEAGDDTYYVEDAGDVVTELPGDGFDRVAFTTSVEHATTVAVPLSSEVELLEAVTPGTEAVLIISGSDTANTMVGTAGVNRLYGNGGDDRLYGLEGADLLEGGDGNDVLIGGAGLDMMFGGFGNDTYYVDDANDQVGEVAGRGSDRIAASVSYALAPNSEVEILEAVNWHDTTPINLTGSEFTNTLIGNDGDNDLIGGGAGDDVFWGLGGNDTYFGNEGANTFYIQDAGDRALDIVEGDNDVVIVFTSYVLQPGAHIERMQPFDTSYFNTAALDLCGNDYNDSIMGTWGPNGLSGGYGNDTLWGLGGDDRLDGGPGIDDMYGGPGDDTFSVDNALDHVSDDQGFADRLVTSVSYHLSGPDSLAGIEFIEAEAPSSTGALDITGSGTDNAITGNDGANVLDGGAGVDVLTGRGGADTFQFTSALTSPVPRSPTAGPYQDTIMDFVSGTDRIALDDAIFTAISPGALAAGAFTIGSHAADADDRIIYDGTTGVLYYDADGIGAGAQVQFATLTGSPALAAGDFVLI